MEKNGEGPRGALSGNKVQDQISNGQDTVILRFVFYFLLHLTLQYVLLPFVRSTFVILPFVIHRLVFRRFVFRRSVSRRFVA